MNIERLVVQLITQGYVMVPDVVVGQELESMQEGFERRCAQVGKRFLDWGDFRVVPELMNYLLHPRLMPVVSRFVEHFGHEPVFANCSGARDVFDPNARIEPFDASDLTQPKLCGWHDDVVGMKNPKASFLPTSLTCLLYLDETSAQNGAYVAAVGSHHLAWIKPDNTPALAPRDMAIGHCQLLPVPVKPGSVIIHRSHHWHGVLPVLRRRRLLLQTFCARAWYDQQEGHTQLTEADLALIPQDRHRWTCSYANI